MVEQELNLREKMIIHLTSSLNEANWREKIRILKQIAEFKAEAEIVIKEIVSLLFDEEVHVRERAALVLADIGGLFKVLWTRLLRLIIKRPI